MRDHIRLTLVRLADFLLAVFDALFPAEIAPGPVGYHLSAEAERVIEAMQRGERSTCHWREPATNDDDTQPFKPVR